MNSIRQIQQLNKRELENGVSPSASWHADYRDTAYIYIGGLPYTLTEGDIIAIFSQYGEPTAVHLQRDKDTGKSKGFAWLKYEDQRSTELAVDNLGGASVLGRVLRVDHARYKAAEGEEGVEQRNEDVKPERAGKEGNEGEEEEEEREMLQEEIELAKLIREHDEEDPMKEYLVREKREEVRAALERIKMGRGGKKERRHKHRHQHREHGEQDRRNSRKRPRGERGGDEEERRHSGRDDTRGDRDRDGGDDGRRRRRNRDDF